MATDFYFQLSVLFHTTQAFYINLQAAAHRCNQSPYRREPEEMYHCQPRVKRLTEISPSPSTETLGVIWRIMIYMILDGAKSGMEQEEKHWARFLPFNIPLKGNLAWNPWHVWWNPTAPCVQWKSPQALDCRRVHMWMFVLDVCACASVRPVNGTRVFVWVLSSQQKCSFPLG